jgi:hypothetical protein
LPETYRKRVKRFCDHYGLVSGRSYTGGIESDISTVLTFSAADHWLQIGGRIGFLITWTVFKSDSAAGFRLGALPDSSGVRIDEIEDLTAIQPFPDATNETSIYIATKVASAAEAEFSEVPCYEWIPRKSARIDPSLPLATVKERNVSTIVRQLASEFREQSVDSACSRAVDMLATGNDASCQHTHSHYGDCGRLIQTSSDKDGGLGSPQTKRSGCAA